MTSRDQSASYYDLTLPNGTHTEVWSVLRAVLTPEEALGYVKACILTRIMRDGRKPDVDRLREAEKVAVEAGMLREAMEAYLATLDAVDSHDPRECEEQTARLEYRLTAQQMAYQSQQEDDAVRIADLRALHAATVRERDEARERRCEADSAAMMAEASHREIQEMYDALRHEHDEAIIRYETEREATRRERDAQAQRAADAEAAFRRERERADALHADLSTERRELAAIRDRYRPRRQSEEPAPEGVPLLRWSDVVQGWTKYSVTATHDSMIWTNQPPAPGEGE